MDVQEAQGPKVKVMETDGQNGQIHRRHERPGCKADGIEAYLDGDWACDDIGKSASGGYLMVAGCRLHSHSRTTGQHALSSGESDIMRMSELLQEAKWTQYNLGFCANGLLPIVLHTDADVTRGLCR